MDEETDFLREQRERKDEVEIGEVKGRQKLGRGSTIGDNVEEDRRGHQPANEHFSIPHQVHGARKISDPAVATWEQSMAEQGVGV